MMYEVDQRAKSAEEDAERLRPDPLAEAQLGGPCRSAGTAGQPRKGKAWGSPPRPSGCVYHYFDGAGGLFQQAPQVELTVASQATTGFDSFFIKRGPRFEIRLKTPISTTGTNRFP